MYAQRRTAEIADVRVRLGFDPPPQPRYDYQTMTLLEEIAGRYDTVLEHVDARRALAFVDVLIAEHADQFGFRRTMYDGWESFRAWTAIKKVTDLAPVLREFARLGWHSRGNPTLPGGASSGYSVTLRHADHGDYHIYFAADLDTSQPDGCEMVQTGTREVPVYELSCPDGENTI